MKKIKKMISLLLVCVMVSALFAACGKKNDPENKTDGTPAPTSSSGKNDDNKTPETKDNAEIVDGRFVETRKITVEVYERGNDGGSKPEDNFYTDFIKEGMLRDHNVEVTFVPVPRFPEQEHLNNLLASGKAPDICVTYDRPTITTYANMGGVINLTPILEENKSLLPNLWNLLTDSNIYANQIPGTGEVWDIEARLVNLARTGVFVREDWLKKLNLSEPTTLQEFENMLIAFRDNAELLLGADADKMIPYVLTIDVGYTADQLIKSFIPNDFTLHENEKNFYVYGYDDRHMLFPGAKEGIRKLNEWYNMDLIWKDFPLYGQQDQTWENLVKAGYVGAFALNWDYAYRNGDEGIDANIKRHFGEEAAYVSVMSFPNDAGLYKKFLSPPFDRKIFFPTTNDEPLASLLYLDWISKPENRQFLQIGEEGITHEVMPDGAIKMMSASGEKIQNSAYNIDYTITNNGLNLIDPEVTIKSMALGYAGIDAKYIEKAYENAIYDGRYGVAINTGMINSEDGMGPVLSEKRNTYLTQAVVAAPDKFDSVYDAGYNDYLASGGQAIIDERKAAWERTYE